MNPFRMLVMAFRAAVRSEVERAMADRRAALRQMPVDDAEIARVRTFLGKAGVTVRESAEVIPLHANQNHAEPPSPAA